MAQAVRDIMERDPVTLDESSTVLDAARQMRDRDIGDVLVTSNDGKLVGIVTDRDTVVRAIADGRDPSGTPLREVCSRSVTTLSPDDSLETAASRMRESSVRRLPVVDDGRPLGIVSIGDLAIERDEQSALAGISAAPGNR
jgi:CBS domain-containing protein